MSTPHDATRLLDHLRPGQRVFIGGIAGESAWLHQALQAEPERARGITFCGTPFPGIDRADWLALHPEARVEGGFMTPALRTGLADAGEARATLLPMDYLALTRHWLEGPAPDVAVAHLSLPDAEGWCSPGVSADFLPLVWPRVGLRLAHLNPRLPRLAGSFRVHVSELHAAVAADAPVAALRHTPGGAVEAAIGAHLAGLVRDGDTLQFGIGSVPAALGQALAGHRRLRFHGGMASEPLRALWQAGALDPDARITAGLVLGDAAFHAFAATLPPLWLTDVRGTHGTAALAAVPRLVAINSAVEVDLFGQVNAERAAGQIQAGAGGLPAFALGAQASPGGRLCICLAATAKGGSVSRIVPALGEQSLCTLTRHLADTVVTEHGAAELRGLGMDARAQALIGIAAPEHREALARAWHAMRARL